MTMKKTLFALILLLSCGEGKEKKEFYRNGKIRSIAREQNGGETELISYDSNGVLLAIEYLKRDTLNGESKYYKGGEISEVVNFKDGLRHGLYLRYYPNGNPSDSAYFEDGNRRGSYVIFYPDKKGKKMFEAYSVIVGNDDYTYYSKRYDPDGKIIEMESPISIKMCFEGTSKKMIKVDFRIEVESGYDSAKVVVGDFDRTFNFQSFSDTLLFDGNTYVYNAEAKKYPLDYLRGSLITYKTIKNEQHSKNDSLISIARKTFYYFEEKIPYDQPVCEKHESKYLP
jgi:antitoxin component YwqK of YwqJK toxin-antitoxin module